MNKNKELMENIEYTQKIINALQDENNKLKEENNKLKDKINCMIKEEYPLQDIIQYHIDKEEERYKNWLKQNKEFLDRYLNEYHKDITKTQNCKTSI